MLSDKFLVRFQSAQVGLPVLLVSLTGLLANTVPAQGQGFLLYLGLKRLCSEEVQVGSVKILSFFFKILLILHHCL